MNTTYKLWTAVALMICAGTASAYDFSVSNATSQKITRIQASEDGKTWGDFNVGDGIAAGSTTKLVWSAATENTGCEWEAKATYADGSESESAKFNFCEDDLTIEFSE